MYRVRRPSALPSRVLVLALLMAVGITAGCGSGDDDQAPAADTGSPSIGEPASYPMQIDTPYGSTVLAKEPERVVVVGPEDVDSVLNLGVVPVGAAGWGDYDDPEGSWGPYFGDTTVIDTTLEPITGGADFEEVLELDPDVIIAVGGIDNLAKGYADLARIAPVVTYPDELDAYAVGDPIVTLRTIARPLDKVAEAEAMITEYEDKLAGIRREHPEFEGKTITLAGLVGKSGLWLHSTSGSASEEFFGELGFEPNPATAGVTGEITEERYDVLDADVLVTMDNNGATPESIGELRANPLYAELDVVENDAAIHLDDFADGVYAASPLSTPSVASMLWLLDRLPDILAPAAEGADSDRE